MRLGCIIIYIRVFSKIEIFIDMCHCVYILASDKKTFPLKLKLESFLCTFYFLLQIYSYVFLILFTIWLYSNFQPLLSQLHVPHNLIYVLIFFSKPSFPLRKQSDKFKETHSELQRSCTSTQLVLTQLFNVVVT